MVRITTDDGESGGGYPDMLAGFRQSTDNADPRLRATGGDRTWFDRLADVADRQAQERLARERREEEDRREQERLRLQAEQRMAEQARQETERRDEYIKKHSSDEGLATFAQIGDAYKKSTPQAADYDSAEIGKAWRMAYATNRYDQIKEQYGRDPFEFDAEAEAAAKAEADYKRTSPLWADDGDGTIETWTAKNQPIYNIPDEMFKTWNASAAKLDARTEIDRVSGEDRRARNLAYTGYGGDIEFARKLSSLAPSEQIRKALKDSGIPILESDLVSSIIGGAAPSVVGGAIGSLLGPGGTMAGALAVGVADRSAVATNPDMTNLQRALLVPDVILNATGTGPLEAAVSKGIVKAAGGRLAAGAATQAAGRSVANAGIMAGFGTAGEMAATGSADPRDLDLTSILTMAGIGAAVPVLSPALRSVFRDVPTEFKAAAGTYVTTRALGADDEEARNYALMAAGFSALKHRGFKGALESGFGMGDVMNRLQHTAGSEPIVDLPTGPNIVYTGRAGLSDNPIRNDTFVTPRLADAEAFARGSSRISGLPPVVYAYEVTGSGALKPSSVEGLASARGAMQVADPAGLRPVGASGVPQRPAFGLSTENVDLGPNNGWDTDPEEIAFGRSPEPQMPTRTPGELRPVERDTLPPARGGQGPDALGDIVGGAREPEFFATQGNTYLVKPVQTQWGERFIVTDSNGVPTEASRRADGYASRETAEFEAKAATRRAQLAADEAPTVARVTPEAPPADGDGVAPPIKPPGPDGGVTLGRETKAALPPTGERIKFEVKIPPRPSAPWGADTSTFPRPGGPRRRIVVDDDPDPIVGDDAKLIDDAVAESAGQVKRPVVSKWLEDIQTKAAGPDEATARARVAQLIGIPRGVIDAVAPTGRYAPRVLEAITASTNVGNFKALETVKYVDELIKGFSKLFGEAASNVVKRELARSTPALLGFGAGMAAGGPDTKEGRQLMALGLFGTYAAHSFDFGVGRRAAFDSITERKIGGNVPSQRGRGAPTGAQIRQPTAPGELNLGEKPEGRAPLKGMAKGGRFSDLHEGVAWDELPASLKTRMGRAIHMVVYPGDFNLSTEQLKAVRTGQKLNSALFEQVQLVQKITGQTITQDNIDQNPRLFQFFTKESVEKALKRAGIMRGDSGTPGFAARLPFEQQRQLGDNIVDAMIKHPDLVPVGDPLTLMAKDLEMKARKVANLTLLSGLTKGEEGDGWIKSRTSQYKDSLEAATKARDEAAPNSAAWVQADETVNAIKARASSEEAALGADTTWGEIKGVAGFKFPPEILKSVEALAVELPGEYGSRLDRTTSFVRTLMFSGDMSAWTMQGGMLAARDPIAMLSYAIPLLRASIQGDGWTATAMQHPEFAALARETALAGVEIGRMTGETAVGVGDIKHIPLARELENRGFQNLLPVGRVLMYRNVRDSYAILEKYAGGGKLGKLGSNNAVSAAEIAAKYVLPVGAGYAAGQTQEDGSWEQYFLMALGGGAAMAGSHVAMGKLGAHAYSSLSPEAQHSVRIKAAADINRSSGILNKSAKGISKQQARTERNWIFRSPALVRNTAEIAKLALNPLGGAESVMARQYLVQTALTVASLAIVAEALSGHGLDSLDPNDPNSVLNPRNFGRIVTGARGSATQSNPLVALLRAFFYHQPAEGEPAGGLGWHGPKEAAKGLAGYVGNRLPDITGQFTNPLLIKPITGGVDQPVSELIGGSPVGDAALSLSKGDFVGAAGNAARMVTPLTAQAAAEAGVTGLPLVRSDPNYNHTGERVVAPLLAAAGFSANPETRPQESKRRTDEAVRELIASNPEYKDIADANGGGLLDRHDLPDKLREKFDATPVGQELKKFSDETRAMGNYEPSQLDKYFAYLDALVDEHVKRLDGIEAAVADGSMSKFEYRKAYQEEQNFYVKEKKHLADPETSPFKDQMMDHKVWDPETKTARTMSVLEYQGRGEHKEDRNVDDWYALLDKATGRDGKPDFDKLDALQSDFRKSLPDDERTYLDERLASFKERGVTDSQGNVAELPTLKRLDEVKDIAKETGYWEVADTLFKDLQTKSPKMFGKFTDYSEFKDTVESTAKENGVDPATVIAYLSGKSRAFKAFDAKVNKQQKTIRARSLELDLGLQDFYERPAVNWKAAQAQQYGDHSYDALSGGDEAMSTPLLARRPAPSAAQRLAFARRYGAKPIFSYFQSN